MDDEAKKPTKGTWNNLGNKQRGIKFDVNQVEQVTFLDNEPEEVPSQFEEDTVYYRFRVKRLDDTLGTIETSAWTLLSELKKLAPLEGKTVQITKKLEKGKQHYSVVQIV